VVERTREDRRRLVYRWATRLLLAVGAVITAFGVLLVVAAWSEDIRIDGDIGYANAEVTAVSYNRTVVRFYSPDGEEHTPETGVLYPADLQVGDRVQVEYQQSNPELVRVGGRGAFVTLLPVGIAVLAAWAVLAPATWWVRRRGKAI
jgi:uncharacterized protein DUF3592